MRTADLAQPGAGPRARGGGSFPIVLAAAMYWVLRWPGVCRLSRLEHPMLAAGRYLVARGTP